MLSPRGVVRISDTENERGGMTLVVEDLLDGGGLFRRRRRRSDVAISIEAGESAAGHMDT